MATKTIEQFILEAKAMHGNAYDYSQVVYVGAMIKVAIVCPVHGLFYQTPNGHLRPKGYGCTDCGLEVKHLKGSAQLKQGRKTTEEFVAEVKLVHGNKFDYSLLNYTGSINKVTLVCALHGVFEILPSSLLLGSGCRACSLKTRTINRRATIGYKQVNLTQEQFIDKANKKHNNRYDYSMVNYKTMHHPVSIICRVHGLFTQNASSHVHTGKGCPHCAKQEGKALWVERSRGRLATLYFIKLYNEQEEFYKIGVTYLGVKSRYGRVYALKDYKYEILATYQSNNAKSVFEWEQSILSSFYYMQYLPKQSFPGQYECFTSADEILACFPIAG